MEKILKKSCLVILLLMAGLPSFADSAMTTAIRIPLATSFVSLDPSGIQDQSSLWVSRQVNCQLIRSNAGNLAMDAADSINFIDPLTLHVKLNQKMRFHDGSAVTSDDVMASFENIKKHRHAYRSIFSWVKNIQKIDDFNFRFLLHKPAPQFLDFLASPLYAVFKKSFIDQASQNSSLWEAPLGCGKYQISHHYKTIHQLVLKPAQNKNLRDLQFYLLGENQVFSYDVDKYDIVGLPIVGDAKAIPNYLTVKIFDPYHVFLALNARLPEWQSRENRCALFSKLDRRPVLQSYGDVAEVAKDIYPRGILGYNSKIDYPADLLAAKKPDLKPLQTGFCLSTLSVSIPLEKRQFYAEMLRSSYGDVLQQTIDNAKEFGKRFEESRCDALVLGLKSNVFDAYEYLLSFTSDDSTINFSGYRNPVIQKMIADSQNLENDFEKSVKYQEISEAVRKECVYYPILTIPMKNVLIKDNLKAPGLGSTPLNEYDLGEIQ